MLETKEFKGVFKKLKTCYQRCRQADIQKKTCVYFVYKVRNTDQNERRMFSTLSLHRSLHALHSVYGRRDRSGFSSMYRYVTISNHSTFSPYPSKYQTNRCHNLTCKDETSDIQKSKLKRKIFPQYPHESPTCPEEEPDQERRGLTQTDNRVSVIYILFFSCNVLLSF